MSSSFSSSSTTKTALTTAAAVLGTTYAVYRYYKIRRLKRRLGNFPASTPWVLPSLDLFHAIRYGVGFEKFIERRMAAVKSSCYYLRFPGMLRPTLVVTNPQDQAELFSKENKFQFVVDIPDTFNDTHGPGSLQNLSGQKHNFYRKIFASLLSPAALKSFTPYFFEAFASMWAELEEQSRSSDELVKISDAICKTQFFLMAKILYGMTPENTPMETMLQMRDDFESQLQGHFAPPGSAKNKKAKEGSQRIHAILAEKFQTVLEARRILIQGNDKGEETKDGRNATKKLDEGTDSTKKDEQLIGNAMETIADALIKEGVDSDPKVIAETIDNLDLLLEASHGTTKDVTTNTLFFLNHPDNAEKLQKLREEAKAFGGKTPIYAQLKGDMPFAEAAIKEGMRLAPILTAVTFAVKDDLSFTFKGQKMQGPISFLMSWGQNFTDPELFPQPSEYFPERWVPDSEIYVSKEAQDAYKPFGAGRHLCLGYQLALLVMKSTLHCFARDETRIIDFDSGKVCKKFGLPFPAYYISDGFPAKVTTKK